MFSNVRLNTRDPWHARAGRSVEGHLTLDSFPQVVDAALAGLGLAFVLEDVVQRQPASLARWMAESRPASRVPGARVADSRGMMQAMSTGTKATYELDQ